MNLSSILGFAFGPTAGAALGLIAVPVTAWVFAPEDVGRLNVLQITLSFYLLLSVLGLDQAYVREYHESKNKPQLLRACFIPGFIFLLLTGTAGAFFASALTEWLFDLPNEWLFYVVIICFLLDYINRFLSLILRMKEKAWAYSVSQVAPKIIQVVLICGLLFFASHKDFYQLLLVILASQLGTAAVLTWCTHNDFMQAVRSQVNTLELQRLLGFGLPLVFAGLAYWGLIATSTIALRSWSSFEELAIYSVANSFAGAAAVFQSIFSIIWAPFVYKWASKNDVAADSIHKIARQALAIICVIATIAGGFSWICDNILPDSYSKVKYILMCLVLQPLLYTLSEITSIGIGIQRKTIYSLWITGFAFLTTIALCFLLIPKFGAAGAAVSNSIAYTIFFIGRTEVSARIWKSFPRKQIYTVISVLLMLAVVMALNQHIPTHVTSGIWFTTFVISLLVFKAEWSNVLRLILQKIHLPF